MASILIVEDERTLGRACQEVLADDGHEVHYAYSAEDALTWLEHRAAHLALIDIGLPGISGLELLQRLTNHHPDTVPIMMTACGDLQTAISAMKDGARDFLLKPLDLNALSVMVDRHLEQRRLRQTWKYEQQERARRFGVHQILGDCPALERAKSLVRRLGSLGSNDRGAAPNLLITGPTGTGKDLLAKTFHYEGVRRERPFVLINCGAIPPTLIESELFGHVAGAFTGAGESKRGLFEVADRGTLFLNELDSLDLPIQAKILTAIDSGRIRPIGSTVEVHLDLQIIAATNKDPTEWIARGKLREDLYHRLRVLHIDLPPLSQRGDDIITLGEHFLAKHCKKFGLPPRRLSQGAKAAMRRYHWPGNVRELSHRLESSVLLGDSDQIEAEFLPAARPNGAPHNTGNGVGRPAFDFSKGPISLEKVEQQLIREALSATKNNLSRAAELLGISRDTLRYRVTRHGLQERPAGNTT